MPSPTRARVRAPELRARGGWINTDHPLSLQELRGRVVVLDFWTSCCANCLHVIEELRTFEAGHADTVVVIGVHSPKFAHEAEHATVRSAVVRHGVHHPVLDDPDLHLWQQYAVHAWPTLVVIDPEGYVVAQAAGEGQVAGLGLLVDELIAEHTERGTLRRGDDLAVADAGRVGELLFPAKAITLPGGDVLVADAGGNDLVRLDRDGQVVARIGTGRRGHDDGASPTFAEPNGLALLPPGLLDYDVVVADTANHLLRGVRLSDGAVVATIDLAAALEGARTVTGAVPAVLSPWDVTWWPARGELVVAAAGVHLMLAVDPVTSATRILAGTTVEGLRDGPGLEGWLAQPSGLAADGDRLWFVDAETSALRWIGLDGVLHTAVGEGLFDFGHVDGPAEQARLQHPLGVTVAPDGRVLVADTYNGAVRSYDPSTQQVGTVADGLAEPSGVGLDGEQLLVVESAGHRLTRLPLDRLPDGTGSTVTGPAQRVQRPVSRLAAGWVQLRVPFTAPPGQQLDHSDGPATRLTVSASPPELLLDGGGEGVELTRTLRLAPGRGVLHVTAQAASCDADPAVEHPACHLARQDWGVPVEVAADGPGELTLPLLG